MRMNWARYFPGNHPLDAGRATFDAFDAPSKSRGLAFPSNCHQAGLAGIGAIAGLAGIGIVTGLAGIGAMGVACAAGI